MNPRLRYPLCSPYGAPDSGGGPGGTGVALSAVGGAITSGTAVFSNSNGVSFGINGQTITASVATGAASINLSAGSTSNLASAFTFADSNGISFGLNAGTITASADCMCDPGVLVDANEPSQSATLGTVVFGNDNNVSFGITGQTITAKAFLGVTAGTDGDFVSQLSFADSNGISFGYDGSTITASVAAGGAPGSISAGTASVALGQVVFSNSNNVSFGLNGSTVTASATVASTQGSIRISAGTTSILSSGFTFSNSNNVSFGIDNGTVTASASVATSLTNIRVSAGTTSNLLSALTFADSNGISFGINASTITASYTVPGFDPVTVSAGTSSKTVGQIVFSNSNGVSFGLNGNTITASAAGANAPSIQFFQNGNGGAAGTLSMSSNIIQLFPVVFDGAFPGNMTVSTLLLDLTANQAAFPTTSMAWSSVINVAFYTRTGSTLSLLNSASSQIAFAAATNITNSYEGNRWFSMHSSIFSTDLTFSHGGEYYMAIFPNGSSSIYAAAALGHVVFLPGSTATRRGTIGVDNTLAGSFLFAPFFGSFTDTAFPVSITQGSQFSSNTRLPRFALNNVLASF